MIAAMQIGTFRSAVCAEGFVGLWALSNFDGDVFLANRSFQRCGSGQELKAPLPCIQPI